MRSLQEDLRLRIRRPGVSTMGELQHRCLLSIFADYHQFYIWDPETSSREAPIDWSDEDVANRAKVARGVVVICPVRNMDVPVEITIWDSEPEVHFNAWQHAIEAPLPTTGVIEIHECTGEAKASFTVKPGDYTVRGLYRGLDRLSEDGLEGEDFYAVQIWPGRCSSLRIIRQWK